MTEKILTIAITSYNRVEELIRCIKSIDCDEYVNDIEIVVSEDKSPKRAEIEKAVLDFKQGSNYSITFHKNEKNLGYDRNLKQLINLARGRYILYVSDDDMFLPGKLNHLIELLSHNDYAVYYSPCYEEENKRYARCYKQSFVIERRGCLIKKHIYDSILFSGLVFKVECIRSIDAERFLNKNYIQVYMFICTLYKYGGYYDNNPLIWVIGDGVNGYGLSESSIKNEFLANRKLALSNLEFHKGLIDVIIMADTDLHVNFIKDFEKEYSKRSIVGMLNAGLESKKTLRDYWAKMKSLNIKLSYKARFYYCFLSLFGAQKTDRLIRIIKKSNCIKGLKYE